MAFNISTIAALFTAASLGGLTVAASPALDSNEPGKDDDLIQIAQVVDTDDDEGPRREPKLPRKVSPEDVESALASAQAELSPQEYARFQKIAEHAGPLAAMRAVMKWKHHDNAERRGPKSGKAKAKGKGKEKGKEKRADREKPETREKPMKGSRDKSEREHGKPDQPGKAEKPEKREKPDKHEKSDRGPGQRDYH